MAWLASDGDFASEMGLDGAHGSLLLLLLPLLLLVLVWVGMGQILRGKSVHVSDSPSSRSVYCQESLTTSGVCGSPSRWAFQQVVNMWTWAKSSASLG